MSKQATSFTPQAFKTTLAIASIMSLRMLGLFMILPVFSLYAEHLTDVTPLLVGVAIGIYGLTQALLQIPFGMLSDRFGRKSIITIGLLIFALGSVVAALSTSIMGVIIGRALQGGGAIAAALLALTADLTYEGHRTKAMAIIGTSIGLSFVAALSLGPLLHHWIGVPGIFWLTAGFAIVGIFILHVIIPQPVTCRFHRDTEPVPQQFKKVLQDSQLMRLNLGIFCLHASLTALFVVLPLVLQRHLPSAHHWQLYLPVLLAAILMMIPFIIYGEKHHHLKQIFVGAIILLSLAELGFVYAADDLFVLGFMLFWFFTAFNLLEASLPSLVSKTVSPDSKGTAMGIYSSFQFLGAFFGGLSGGWLHHHYSIPAVFIYCALLALLWLSLAITMRTPRYLSNHLLNVGALNPQQANALTQQLAKIPGVAEAVIIVEDQIAYLKVDQTILDMAALDELSVAENARC